MNRRNTLYMQKAAIAAAVYLVLRYLLPLVFPFFCAWLTVAALNQFRHRISMRLVPLSAGVLSILFLAVLLFLLLSGYLLYPPIRELFPVWQDFLLRMPLLSDWIPSSLLGQLTRMMPSVFSWLFGIFLYFVSLLLFARDWKAFDAMLSKLPFYQMVRNAGSRMATACQNWVHAQIRIMFVITLECAAGYWLLLHLPGAGLWAVLTGFLDALPVFGTGIVFLPWILVELLRQRFLVCLKLSILYAITWLTRELLEPGLLGNGLGLLPVCFLISVIAGLKLFGPVGLFTGPFGILLIRELWVELETPASPHTSSVCPSGDDEKTS